MKKKSKQTMKLDLNMETRKQVSLLNEDEQQEIYKIARYLRNNHYDTVEMNIILTKVIEQFLDCSHQQNVNGNRKKIKDLKPFISKIVEKIPMKEEKLKQKQKDYERFLGACTWEVFTMFIVLLFIQNYFHGTYLINYSIDVIPAILCFYLSIQYFINKLRICKRYNFPSNIVYLDIFVFLFCLLIKLLVPSPFDITFLLFVVSYFISKKKISKLFESYS